MKYFQYNNITIKNNKILLTEIHNMNHNLKLLNLFRLYYKNVSIEN